MTDVISMSVGFELRTTTGNYPLVAAQATFAANGQNVAVCDLAVGYRDGKNGVPTYVSLKRGTLASLWVLASPTAIARGPGYYKFYPGFVPDADFVLFTGYIDDFTPGDLSVGQFTVRVQLLGRLSHLAGGSLASSNITAASYATTTSNYIFGEGGDDTSLVGVTDASTNLWAGIQSALLRIANYEAPTDLPKSSLGRVIDSVFGTAVNTSAADIIEAITDTMNGTSGADMLNWDNDRSANERFSIINAINQVLLSDWAYEPYLTKIMNIGSMLYCTLVEFGDQIVMVPHVPYFRSQSAVQIDADTYSGITVPSTQYVNVSGAVLVDSDGHDRPSVISGGAVAGAYRMPGELDGQIITSQMPGYTGAAAGSYIQGGTDARTIANASIVNEADGSVNLSQNILGNLLAKYATWDANYGGRRAAIVCPMFRADIGPLTAVRVDYPNNEAVIAGGESPAIYGVVQSVTVQLDTSNGGMASTRFDLSFVRSYVQQLQYIDPGLTSSAEHPFFRTNYIGAPLYRSNRYSPGV